MSTISPQYGQVTSADVSAVPSPDGNSSSRSSPFTSLAYLLAERGLDACEVVPAVSHSVIFEYELRRNRRAEAKRERRSGVEFFVGERANSRCRFLAVATKQIDRIRLRYVCELGRVFSVH